MAFTESEFTEGSGGSTGIGVDDYGTAGDAVGGGDTGGWMIELGVAAVTGLFRGYLAWQDYEEAWEQAKAEAAAEWEQARQEAQARVDRAKQTLEDALGALGEHERDTGATPAKDFLEKYLGEDSFIIKELERKAKEREDGEYTYTYATYSDWYDATREEYDAAVEEGLEDSWLDYLHEQQMGELGTYGIRRAELEITVELARRQLTIAADFLDVSRRFVDRSYGEEATAAMRQHQTHQSMAGASGMRAGTAHETAREYQVARMEGLNLWREESLYKIANRRKELGVKREEINLMEDTGLAKLDQMLTSARTGYESDVEDIYRVLGDIREDLDLSLDRFSEEGRRRSFWASFFGGAQSGFQFATGIGDQSGWW